MFSKDPGGVGREGSMARKGASRMILLVWVGASKFWVRMGRVFAGGGVVVPWALFSSAKNWAEAWRPRAVASPVRRLCAANRAAWGSIFIKSSASAMGKFMVNHR